MYKVMMAACALVLATAGGSWAQATVVHNVIAASGAPAPAPADGTYSVLSLVASVGESLQVNSSGQVAYRALIAGDANIVGLFLHDGTSAAVVALQRTVAPAGGNYGGVDSFHLNNSGEIAFRSGLNGGSSVQGIFLFDGTAASTIALQGMASPAGGTYDFLSSPRLNAVGQVAFGAVVSGGPNGIFRYDSSTGTPIALAGTAAPAGGTYVNVGSAGVVQLNANGQVAFHSTLSGSLSTPGTFLHDGTTATALAVHRTAAPAGGNYGSVLSGVDIQLNDSGQAAFRSTLIGGGSTEGIFLHDGTTTVALALQGTAAPAGGIYSSLPQRLDMNSSGLVVYQAELAGGSSTQGIFLHDGTTAAALALSGTAAPGTTGMFQSFGTAPRVNDLGVVVLHATLAAGGDVTPENNVGYWYGTDPSNLSLLVRKGDSLFVNGMNRTLESFLAGASLSDAGLAWTARFTDGTSAIIHTTFTVVPEPTTGVQLGLLALGAARLRRSLRAVGGRGTPCS
ncbi:MAG TPA: hypothetical protein PJ982_07870 [Lacipirellulaceae bacterium]|nr:hypothetical protein [Lacipirellulaceae bacterium]